MKLFDRDISFMLLIGAVGSCGWIWFRLATGMTLEDALISYRYAQNLALGNGFVYNVGEQVLGTTTPLLTLILGLFGWIFGLSSIPTLSNICLFAASLGAGLFTFLGLRALNWSRGFSGFVMLALCLHPLTMWTTAGGMETPLVIFLMALAFWSLATQRVPLAAYASSLLILTRIDGVFWAAGIYLLILLEDRRAFLKSLGIAALVLLPWLIFAQLYFGSVIPNTVAAKQVIGNEAALSLSGFLSEARWFANRFASAAPFSTVVGLLLFLLGAITLFRKSHPRILRWLVVYPFLFAAAFYLGRAPRFPWYFVPAAWSCLIVGLVGLHDLWSYLSVRLRREFPTVAAVFGILWVAAFVWKDIETAEFHTAYQVNEDGARKQLGLWLRDHTPAAGAVAMEAIGYQGYYSQRRVIDLAGLVSPQVVDIRRTSRSNAESFERIREELRPDFIVLRSFEYQENEHFHGGKLFENEGQKTHFDSTYSSVREFTAPLPEFWGNLSRLTVFERTG